MKKEYKYLAIFCFILFLRISPLFSGGITTSNAGQLPLIINTWHFKEANKIAWEVLHKTNKNVALEALVEGLTACERLQCDGTVGYGGSPDEKGETTLDAMIMDGNNQNMGAVAAMRDIKDAAKVARHVLEYTEHSLLVGEAATDFAEMMGFQRDSLATKESLTKWFTWFNTNCQPNFWKNVSPDPRQRCGPYKPLPICEKTPATETIDERDRYEFGEKNHDTIGMVVIDKEGHIFAGTSTNGASHKIPGRVGDSPIPGAGAYADNEVGAAVATGDGDVMMRFLPSALAVEFLRQGLTPAKAAENVIMRMLLKYPLLSGAVIVVDRFGKYSAACAGMPRFPFSIVSGDPMQPSKIEYKECLKSISKDFATDQEHIQTVSNEIEEPIISVVGIDQNQESESKEKIEDKSSNSKLKVEL